MNHQTMRRTMLAVAASAALAAGGGSASAATDAAGVIALRAVAAEYVDATPPQHYLVVLDASGSMSYSLAGEGTLDGGQGARCELESASPLPPSEACEGGRAAPWGIVTERRIYQAKDAIRAIIDSMRPQDTMRIVAYATDHGLAGNVQALPADGWSGDKAALNGLLLQAGATAGDPYRTAGDSADAQGLAALPGILASAPAAAPDGRAYQTRVVVFADSPPNVFPDGSPSPARDICPMLSAYQAMTVEDCQMGYDAAAQQPRPASATVAAAQQLKQQFGDVMIFGFSMAARSSQTLAQVVSSPSMLYSYFDGMGPMIPDIIQPRRTTRCEAVAAPWASAVAPERVAGGSVTLRSEGGGATVAQVPIAVDDQGGMSYSLAGVAAGTYQISATITYTGLDGETREYTAVGLDDGAGASAITVEFDGQTAPQLFIQQASADDVCDA